VSERHLHLRDLGGIDVIVVDDSLGMRQLLTTVLQSFGVGCVRPAENGLDALKLGREKPADLMIIDWEMRPMDGLTLLKELRRVTNYPAAFTPVLILTAHSQPHVVRAALKHGANQFLAKPLVPQTLLNRMLWALNDRRSFVEQDGFFVHRAGHTEAIPAPTTGLNGTAAPPNPAEMWVID
jgi:DNA-binding response OmpR family regulator